MLSMVVVPIGGDVEGPVLGGAGVPYMRVAVLVTWRCTSGGIISVDGGDVRHQRGSAVPPGLALIGSESVLG